MGFLDHRFDLTGTPFAEEDLDYARGYWRFLIDRVAPTWLQHPQGLLAIHWQSETVPSAVRLIDIAKMLFSLARSISPESHPTFGAKLHQLLHSDGVQHKEQVTELVVGALLTRLDRPIRMEPTSSTSFRSGSTPASVDYAVEWIEEDGDVFVESTVFHIGHLIAWEAAIADLKRRFEIAVTAKGLNRKLAIVAPLSLTRTTLSDSAIADVLRIIKQHQQGSHSVRLGDDDLLLKWSPAVHLETWPAGDAHKVPGFAFTTGAGITIGAFAATSVTLKWPGDTEDLVNRSLRNTLNAKRRQFQLAAPYLLVIRLLNHRMPLEGTINLLSRRIFSNPQYKWISAIGIMRLTQAQNTGYNPAVTLVQNLKATHPLPLSFVSALAGEPPPPA